MRLDWTTPSAAASAEAKTALESGTQRGHCCLGRKALALIERRGHCPHRVGLPGAESRGVWSYSTVCAPFRPPTQDDDPPAFWRNERPVPSRGWIRIGCARPSPPPDPGRLTVHRTTAEPAPRTWRTFMQPPAIGHWTNGPIIDRGASSERAVSRALPLSGEGSSLRAFGSAPAPSRLGRGAGSAGCASFRGAGRVRLHARRGERR
jgi:hypothetical protein